jgi:hypothetical protein
MTDEGKTPRYDAFEPTSGLKQGDVGLGDLIRFRAGYELVEGRVRETASDGAVVGIYVGRTPYSAGLPFVELVEKATPVDRLEIRVDHLERQLKAMRKTMLRIIL